MTKTTLSILAGAAAFVIQGAPALADEVRLDTSNRDQISAAATPANAVVDDRDGRDGRDRDRDRPIQKGAEKGSQKGKGAAQKFEKATQKGKTASQKGEKGAQKGRDGRDRDDHDRRPQ